MTAQTGLPLPKGGLHTHAERKGLIGTQGTECGIKAEHLIVEMSGPCQLKRPLEALEACRRLPETCWRLQEVVDLCICCRAFET